MIILDEDQILTEIFTSNILREKGENLNITISENGSNITKQKTFVDEAVDVVKATPGAIGDFGVGVVKGTPVGASKFGTEIMDTITNGAYSKSFVPYIEEKLPIIGDINNYINNLLKPEGTAQEVGSALGEGVGQVVLPGAMASQALKGANLGSTFLRNVLGYGSAEALGINAQDQGLLELGTSFFVSNDNLKQEIINSLKANEDQSVLMQKLQKAPQRFFEGGVVGEALGKAVEGVGVLYNAMKGSDKIKNALQGVGEKAQRELDFNQGTTSLSSMGSGEIDTAINKGLSKLAPKPKFAPEGTRANKLPHQLLVENTNTENVLYPVTQSFIPTNKTKNFENIDLALENNPNALKSTENWLKFQNETMGGKFLPAPPFQAIKYANDPNAMADKLKKLTPEMKKGVDEGFGFVKEIRNLYDQPTTDPKITADLFVWGILSRGAGPVQQESAFIDIIDGASDLVNKAVNGQFTKEDQVTWEQTIKKLLPEGSPGKQVTQNVNATGKLLFELGKKVDGSDKSVLQTLHDMIKDKNVPAKQIRREFLNLTEGAGIDNKVVSFILLVAGRDDVLVMDRIQGRHIWDDGTFEGKNIYDGFSKEGTTVKEGLIGIFTGPRGLLLTEALEDGLRANIEETYNILGRPDDASLGRWHWENWVIEGEQVVSHSTLEGIAKQNVVGTSVVEGKPGTFSSGARYIKLEEGTFYEYPLSDGSTVFMTPSRQKEFESFIKNPKNGIVPKGFKVTEEKDIPWYEREGINREKLDQTAREFSNANPKRIVEEGSKGAGENTNTISGGSRASELGGIDGPN